MTFNKLERLIYILPNTADKKLLLQKTHAAIDNGVKWIQVRIKNIEEKRLYEIAQEIKEVADKNQVKITINDNPFVAAQIYAYGVHVGLQDMPVSEVKSIAGKDKVIGGTANTIDHILYQIKQGADYIGLGPFRFTTTKTRLSPVLGLEGYKNIMQKLHLMKKNIPVFAIGGIQPEDVVNLLKTGVYGVAVSSAVSNNPGNAEKFLKKIADAVKDCR